MRQIKIGLFLALLMLNLGAMAGEDTHVVIIKSFKFNPPEITIKRGETIRWENNEKRQYHSVWFEETGEPETDYFFPDESYERSFDKIGTFPYRCGPHKEMKGVAHVID